MINFSLGRRNEGEHVRHDDRDHDLDYDYGGDDRAGRAREGGVGSRLPGEGGGHFVRR